MQYEEWRIDHAESHGEYRNRGSNVDNVGETMVS